MKCVPMLLSLSLIHIYGNFILMHSVGSIPHGAEIDAPLNYADYYFLEGIMRKRDLGISTLRYYDKEGLFPHLKRVNGVRQFSEIEIETLRVID